MADQQDKKPTGDEVTDSVASPEESKRDSKLSWMQFFDNEKYRHHLMLIKTRQYKELLSVLRQGSTNPDNYKPPIELPSPEEVFPPCDNADDDITNSQSDLYLDFSETSSYPTLSTGSTYSTQNSTTEGKHNRRLTIVLVLFGLTVLVGMSVTLGVILHVRSDKEESSLSRSRTDDVNKLEDVYSPSHPQSSTESLSAHQSYTSETPQWFKSSLLQNSQSTLSHFSLSPLANLLSTPPMTFSSNSKPANPQMFKPSTFALPRLSTTTLPSSFELVPSSSLFHSTSKPVSQYYSSTVPNSPMSSLLKMLKSPLPIDRPPVLSEILLQPPTPPVTRLSVLLQTQWSAPSMPNKDTYVPSLFQPASQPLIHMTPPSNPQFSLSALPALSLSGTSSAEKQHVLTYPNSQSSTSSHQNSQMQKISSHHQLVNSPPATDSLSHLSVSSPSKSWKTTGPQKSISTLSGLSPESIPKMYRSAISQLATTRKPIIIVTLKQFQSTIPAPLMSKTERIYNPHSPHFLKQSIARGFISSIPMGSTHSPGYDFREPHLNTFRIPSSNSFGQGSRHLQLKPFGMPTSSDPAVVTPSDSLRPHFRAPVQSEWIQSTTKTPPRMLYSPSQISGPARLSHPSSDGSHNYMSKMTLPVTATQGGATDLKTELATNTTSPISEGESQTLKETSGHEFVLSEIRTSLFDKAAGRPTKEVIVTTERPQGATASVITLLFSHTGSVPTGESAHEAITTSVLTQRQDNAHMSIGSNSVEMFKLRKQTSFPFSVASTIRPAPSSLQKDEGNEGNISDDITELVNVRRSNVSSSNNNVSTFGNYYSSKSSLGRLPNRQDGHLGGALDTSSSMYPDRNLTVLTEENRVEKYTHTLVNTTSNPQNADTATSSESISSSSRHGALDANNDVVASYLRSIENAGMNRSLASAETDIKQSSILGMALSSSETKVTKTTSTTKDNSNDMRILNTSYGNLYNTGDMGTLYANNMTSFVGTQVDSNPYHTKVTPTVAGSDPADSGDVSQIDQGINYPTNDANRDNSSTSNTRNIIQTGHANRDGISTSNTRNIIQSGDASRDNNSPSNTKDITQSDDANTDNSNKSNTRSIIQSDDANRDDSSTSNTRNIIQSGVANRDGSSTSNTRNIIQSDDANRDDSSTSNTRNIIQSGIENRDGSSTSNTRNIIQSGVANRDGSSTSNTRNIIQSGIENRDDSNKSNTRNIIQSGHANRDGSSTSNTRNIIQSGIANRDGSSTSNTRNIIQSGVANRDGSSTSNTRNIIQSDDANRDDSSTSNTRNIIQSGIENRDGSSTSNTRNIIQSGVANRDGSSTSNTRNIIQSDDANRDDSSTSNTRNIIQSGIENRDGSSTSNTRNIIQSGVANRDGSSTSNTRNIIQSGDAWLASMLAPLSSTVAETQNPEGGSNRESELVMAISNQTSKSTETSNQLSIGTINRQPVGTPELNHQSKETSNQHSKGTSYQPLMGILNKQSTKMPLDQLVGASTHLSTETPNYSLTGSTNRQSSKPSNQHSIETSDQQLTEALHQRFIGTSHEKSIGTSSQQSNGTSTQHSSETSHQQIIGTPHQLLKQAVGISNENLRKTSNQESIETQNQSLGGSINVLSTGPSIQPSNGSINLLSNQTSNQQTLGILNQQSRATSNQPTRETSSLQDTVTLNNQTMRPLNRTSMTTSSQQFRNTGDVESIENLNQQSLETSNQQSTAPLNQQSLGTSNQQFVGTTNQHSSRTTNQKSSGTLNQQSRKTSFSKDNSKLPPAIVIWDKSTPLSTSNKTLSKSRVTSIKSEDEVHVSSTQSANSKTIQTSEAVTRRRSETKANTIQTPKTVSGRSSVTKSKIPLPNTKRALVVTTVRNIKYPKVPQTNATTKESSSSRETTSDRNISASNATTNTSTATTATTPTATTTTATTTGATTTTLDPFASYQGVGNPDGGSGLSLSDLESALKKDGLNNQGVLLDYSLLLQNLPPPETLPRAMATKIAAKPPPIPTARPPLTPKPPEIKIIAPDVVAEIGMSPTSNLKVVCTAQKAWGWTYIAISRYEGDSEFSLEFLGGVDKKDEWPFIPIDSRMSDFTLHRDDDQVTFALETKYALCEDKGRYLCEVKVNRTFFSKTFNVDVKKRPEQPDLKFPEDVFEGQNVWLVTTWDAGNPVIGYIVHDIVQGFTGERKIIYDPDSLWLSPQRIMPLPKEYTSLLVGLVILMLFIVGLARGRFKFAANVFLWNEKAILHAQHSFDASYNLYGLPYAATSESSKAWYKDCAVMIENRYSVTPELSWNGTEIIAHILPKENATIYERSIAERVKYDRKIMTVLDKNICGGQTNVQIAHPYRSDKYITCYSSGPAVTTCPSLHVFDEITKVCVRSQIHH